jgi:uncharacterized protein YgfB (UPF0149 family)
MPRRVPCAVLLAMTPTPESPPPLDYDALSDALSRSGAVIALPELHGGVCGALCAAGAPGAERWLVDCLRDQELPSVDADLARALAELVGTSWHMLNDQALAFAPLLPDDDAPLGEQVQALALWCHGFLGAVAVSGSSEDGEDVGEILRDFAEISRAGLSEAEAAGDDRPDFALAEIQEYVRVGAQLVFEELGPRRAAAAELH